MWPLRVFLTFNFSTKPTICFAMVMLKPGFLKVMSPVLRYFLCLFKSIPLQLPQFIGTVNLRVGLPFPKTSARGVLGPPISIISVLPQFFPLPLNDCSFTLQYPSLIDSVLPLPEGLNFSCDSSLVLTNLLLDNSQPVLSDINTCAQLIRCQKVQSHLTSCITCGHTHTISYNFLLKFVSIDSTSLFLLSKPFPKL